jgi:hypothetical protein
MIEERVPELAEQDGTAAARTDGDAVGAERPRSALGRRLREIRARIVASGVPLLNAEELEAEIAERRGSREELP